MVLSPRAVLHPGGHVDGEGSETSNDPRHGFWPKPARNEQAPGRQAGGGRRVERAARASGTSGLVAVYQEVVGRVAGPFAHEIGPRPCPQRLDRPPRPSPVQTPQIFTFTGIAPRPARAPDRDAP